MTMMVRDEADVLEANLRFHFAVGVDFVVAIDNGSQDGSVELLRRYESAGLLHLMLRHTDEYGRRHDEWATDMARLAAAEFDADWVINNDADEFWWPVTGTLKDAFAQVRRPYGALLAPRPEFAARPDGPGSFIDRLTFREARSRALPKLAHRGMEDVKVGKGSHRITRGEGPEHASRRPGRPILRPVSAAFFDDDLVVPAPVAPVRILHFPLRSYQQFEARMRRILFQEAGDVTGARKHLQARVENAGLEALYADLSHDDARAQAEVEAGALVEDTSLRDHLVRCPDPLAGRSSGGGEVAVQLPHERRKAELAQLEEDMMRALVRNEHAVAQDRAQLRRRVKSQARHLGELKAELRQAQGAQRAAEKRAATLAKRLRAAESAPRGLGRVAARLRVERRRRDSR